MDASDDADVVDWNCCRCVVVDDGMDADVEVVGPDVAVVDVVVDMVVVADSAEGTKNCAILVVVSYCAAAAAGICGGGGDGFCISVRQRRVFDQADEAIV